MSYDDGYGDVFASDLEREAGVARAMYLEEIYMAREEQQIAQAARKERFENSERFKEAATLVAGINGNKNIKLALIKKVHQNSLESAIVRYMTKEGLPEYYAAILRSPNCIDNLVEGVFYKVCKLQPAQNISEEIRSLSNSLRSNPNRLTPYDRVAQIQQFIHRIVDQYLWEGAAQSIPVAPMKNALSAARLHLSILDVTEHRPGYVAFVDNLSAAALQLENDEPRPSTAPQGKRSWPKWRVRHLRPFSYYFPQENRVLLQALKDLDESVPSDRFVHDALLLCMLDRDVF